MNKMLSIVFSAFIICIVTVPAYAKQDFIESGDYWYKINDDGTAKITSYLGTEKDVVVPDSIDGIAVTAIGREAFLYHTLPDGITSITLPSSLESVEDRALFAVGVQNYYIDESNETFFTDDGVLYMKSDMSVCAYPCNKEDLTYTVPEGAKKICTYAFYEANNLAQIELPESVTEIEEGAFSSVKILKFIDLSHVSVIGRDAFRGSSMLEFVYIPESIQIIGEGAFDGTLFTGTNKELKLSGNVKDIGKRAFKGWPITSFYVSPENEKYAAIEGVLFNKADKSLLMYPLDCTNSTYTVPEGILRIDESAFEDNPNIQEVILPDSVNSICINAFSNCEVLNSVNYGDGLIQFEGKAFDNCKQFHRLYIPAKMEIIPESFFYMSYVDEILISPENVCFSIHDDALFNDNTKTLEYFLGDATQPYTIPDGTISIGDYAFLNAPEIRITIPSSVEKVGTGSFFFSTSTTLIVERGSPVAEMLENGDLTCKYEYTDSLDWLSAGN